MKSRGKRSAKICEAANANEIPIINATAAEREALAAHLYYERRRPVWGAVSTMRSPSRSAHPGKPAPYPYSENSPYRKAALRKFPFCLIYCILPRKIVVIAVHDSRRDPRRWQART